MFAINTENHKNNKKKIIKKTKKNHILRIVNNSFCCLQYVCS